MKNFEEFKKDLAEEISKVKPSEMLSKSIQEAYESNKDEALKQHGITLVAQAFEDNLASQGKAVVTSVSALDFIKNPKLQEEVFGPYSIIVECDDIKQLDEVIFSLDGQLSATVMGEENEMKTFENQILALENKCGRILFNGVPTGVEVCASMQHGGPFPAATDARFTSVGTGAIKRFVRPVCFQDCPSFLLPLELRDENPLNILRLVNDEYSKESL